MTAIVLKRESDNYWNLIKDASDEVKLALIMRLSDALVPAVEEKKAVKKKLDASDYAGIWDDEHFMDVDDINNAIRDARHVKSNRDELWDKLMILVTENIKDFYNIRNIQIENWIERDK